MMGGEEEEVQRAHSHTHTIGLSDSSTFIVSVRFSSDMTGRNAMGGGDRKGVNEEHTHKQTNNNTPLMIGFLHTSLIQRSTLVLNCEKW